MLEKTVSVSDIFMTHVKNILTCFIYHFSQQCFVHYNSYVYGIISGVATSNHP